jgi:repressor LexA
MNYLFPERFQELLNSSSITYEELKDLLGVKSKGTITKYANGQIKNVSISMICKIAEIFEVSPIWLIGWSNNKNYKIKD